MATAELVQERKKVKGGGVQRSWAVATTERAGRGSGGPPAGGIRVRTPEAAANRAKGESLRSGSKRGLVEISTIGGWISGVTAK